MLKKLRILVIIGFNILVITDFNVLVLASRYGCRRIIMSMLNVLVCCPRYLRMLLGVCSKKNRPWCSLIDSQEVFVSMWMVHK